MKITSLERIEVPTNEAHAASMVYFNGHRIVTWFGGDQEGMFCDIYAMMDDQEPVIMARANRYNTKVNSLWNPIIMNVDNSLILAFKEGRFCDCWQTKVGLVKIIDDKLQPLETTSAIPAGFNFTVKTKPWREGDKYICGSSVETSWDWSAYVETYKIGPGIAVTGRSNPIKPVDGIKGVIQPAIWWQDDKYHMLLRSSSDSEFLYHSQTVNGHPLIWEPAEPTNFKNPNSSVDVLLHSSGKLYLAHNTESDCRVPLRISEIIVEGNVIRSPHHVELTTSVEEARELYPYARTFELSYPYMIEGPGGKIDVAHTFCRKEIRITEVEV